MKRLAKMIAPVLAVLLLLAGCGETPAATDDTVGMITDWEDGSSWVLSRHQAGVLSGEGYYYLLDNGFLYFADTSNGVEVCLCSKPGCLHENGTEQEKEQCEARIEVGTMFMPMFFWDNHLYYIGRDLYGTHVYRRDAAGMAQTVVADIGAQYTREKKNVDLWDYVHLGDYFYYTAIVRSVVVDAEMNETQVEEMTYIARLDLKTNKEEILLESVEYLKLDAVCPEGLLFSYFDNENVNREEEDYLEQLHETGSYVKFRDSKTGSVTTVLSRKFRDLNTVKAVRGSKLYYSRTVGNQNEVWEYDMAAESDRPVLYGNATQIDGRCAIQTVDGVSALIDLRTGKFLPTAFPGERLSVQTVSADGVVLKRSIYEGSTATSTTYCYVKLDSLADGLQEEDALDLYTYYYKKTATSYEEMLEQMGG